MTRVISHLRLRTHSMYSVFIINGALGARRTQFRHWAYDFRHCAPDVCTFFRPIIIHIHWGVHWENLGCTR